MRRVTRGLAASALLAVGAAFAAAPALAQSAQELEAANPNPNDWLSYHGSYKDYDFSGLHQINTRNVKNLEVAWMHFPGRTTRGLQSMPLAKDGVLYYSGSYSRVFALDGATGKVLWAYYPKLDEELIARQTHTPYNRGMAMGDGRLYIGTVDGRLIALDMKTGKPDWDTKLQNSEKLTVGFTGAPLFVRGKVIIGSQGGEWPWRGPIFGVDAKTGKKLWQFFTSGGTPEAKKTWGNDTWRTGGGGGWMPGTYDAKTNTVWWGTANPAPLYDWSGHDWKNNGAAPGRQPLHLLGDRARSGYRQAEVLPPGTAARRLGLRQRRGRVRADRPQRSQLHGAPEQGRVHLRLRPRQRQAR